MLVSTLPHSRILAFSLTIREDLDMQSMDVALDLVGRPQLGWPRAGEFPPLGARLRWVQAARQTNAASYWADG